jgi:hypothetical protein
VCCEPDASLPFARGAFRLAVCADAFSRVRAKRQFVEESLRLIDGAGGRRAFVMTGLRNRLASHPSGGDLDPAHYRRLFERGAPAVFRESRLAAGIAAGAADLGAPDDWAALDGEAALTIVARAGAVLR